MTVDFAFRVVKKRVRAVDGSITDEESRLFYSLAKDGPGKGVIVEIGSFLGRSTIFLASGSAAGSREKVYAIDPHRGAPVINKQFSGPTYKAFLANLKRAGVARKVQPIKKYSTEAIKKWHKPIRFLFIDGDHSYNVVKKDIQQWEPYVVDSGVIALHDALNPGVGPPRAIVKLLINSRRFSRMGVVGSVFYCVKKPPQGTAEQVNLLIFGSAMKLVSWLLSIKKGSVPPRLRTIIRQYLVKTYIKKVLARATLIFSPKLY